MRPQGADTTTNEVLANVDLSGRIILITGVSSGLGVETARALEQHGAQLVLTARDVAKAREALTVAGVDHRRVDLRALDLADLASVRRFTDDIRAEYKGLDVLIANAGVMATPEGQTVDGFETQFGTNFLGHFLLIERLADLLLSSAPSRVVLVSSAGHRISDVDLRDPNFTSAPYDPWLAYGRSKTALVLFAVELDRRLSGLGVRATAVHPGEIKTALSRHLDDESRALAAVRLAGRELVVKSLEAGAATIAWAAVVAGAEEIGGQYCENCRVAELTDDPESPTGAFAYAFDPDHAGALWAQAEQLVGEAFERPARRP